MRDDPQHFMVNAVPYRAEPPCTLELDFYSMERIYDAPGMLLPQLPPDLEPLVRLPAL